MKINFLKILVAIVFLLSVLSMTALAQDAAKSKPTHREVAVTFDDLLWQGPPLSTQETRAMTEKLLRSLKANGVPVFADVNERKLYEDGKLNPERVAILRMWLDAGAELGNHTYSHMALNSDHTLAAVEQDLIRGETVTKRLLSERGMKLVVLMA